MSGNNVVFTYFEMTDIHLMYFLAGCNSLETKRLNEPYFSVTESLHVTNRFLLYMHTSVELEFFFLKDMKQEDLNRSVQLKNVLNGISCHKP